MMIIVIGNIVMLKSTGQTGMGIEATEEGVLTGESRKAVAGTDQSMTGEGHLHHGEGHHLQEEDHLLMEELHLTEEHPLATEVVSAAGRGIATARAEDRLLQKDLTEKSTSEQKGLKQNLEAEVWGVAFRRAYSSQM
ncbi:hypothetical protein NDU88_004942 [Pleurodeles waltl]|uniref:Uncharacterized protein n=1 Tax=Pleurodeles waltl TaxID=8319 RepID=A0AAV7VIJ4_PLEWA|nr:hypothetical protein NDU88_004942 [Pleurodeles waltl]